MLNKSTKGLIILLMILLILLVVFGCGGSKKKGSSTKKDEEKNRALQRNATIGTEEAKRYSLPICEGLDCAKDGILCKLYVPATDPGVCKEGPTLNCICQERTICTLDASDYRPPTFPMNPGALLPYNFGHCKSPEQIK